MMTHDTVAIENAKPFLACTKGQYAGDDIPVPATGMLIGRDPFACQLVFDKDEQISRYHCRVVYDRRSGFFVITDLNSTNGVYWESGIRLDPGDKMLLTPGESFSLCCGRIEFKTFVIV